MAKILIAEDERDIRELISFTLRFAGHDVVATKDGQEALQAARAEPPELIILDVRMPKMTGYEVCQTIKSDPLLKHIPVVFLSAKGQEAEVRTGLEAGAEAYILKPFAPDEFTKKIAEILQSGS